VEGRASRPSQPGGDARIPTSKLGSTAVTITRSRHWRRDIGWVIERF
jgi:hypothetical protein